jgi:stage II sporulation protein D
MRRRWKKTALFVLSAIGIPILITCCFQRQKGLIFSKEKCIEEYLPAMLYLSINQSYEIEVLKAQAVLIRTNCYRVHNASDEFFKKAEEFYKRNITNIEVQRQLDWLEHLIQTTDEKVLMFRGNLCSAAYHKVSAGKTRNGVETMMNEEFAYLSSVDSSLDTNSADYIDSFSFNKETFVICLNESYPQAHITREALESQIKILSTDEVGYVLRMQVGDVEVGGEEFRLKLNLNSSCFTVENYENEIVFVCKGVGHGLGMSQYGANLLAKEGYMYEEILKYYFPKAIIE